MTEVTDTAALWLGDSTGWSLFRGAILLLIGVGLARLASRAFASFFAEHLTLHAASVARRLVFYGVLSLFLAMALREIGFDLHVLLGAAGIVSVAIGVASQTAASNFVSGIFLLIERPFSVSQVIRVGSTTGEVISIDLLSTTLRTFDNLAVRIPNESMMKSEITNFSKFPIRRYDLQVGVAYREDLSHVQTVLEDVARRNALCLEEPKPLVILQGFGDSSLDIQFSVWSLSANYLVLRNSIQVEIKDAFDEAGIEIPFPHRTLYVGSDTDPFPVDVLDPGTDDESSGS